MNLRCEIWDVVILSLFAACDATEFLPCVYGRGPSPLEVRVNGCDTLPCQFIRGRSLNAEIVFIAGRKITALSPSIYALVGGIWINYAVPDNDGCRTLMDSQCPLNPGEISTYNFTLPVQRGYPKIRLEVEHMLLDDVQSPVFCYRIPGVVIDPKRNS